MFIIGSYFESQRLRNFSNINLKVSKLEIMHLFERNCKAEIACTYDSLESFSILCRRCLCFSSPRHHTSTLTKPYKCKILKPFVARKSAMNFTIPEGGHLQLSQGKYSAILVYLEGEMYGLRDVYSFIFWHLYVLGFLK